jgi:hypothetical protein
MGLLTCQGMLACKVVEGSMHREQYLEFLEHKVVSFHGPILAGSPLNCSLNHVLQLPLCSAYPGPLSVLVMDNARIHHGPEVLELCTRFGMYFSH